MKRDMDLCRIILFEIEKWEDKMPRSRKVEVEGYEQSAISYNILLLAEAYLVKAIEVSTADELILHPSRLTWEGHEFLEAARDDTIWNQAKELLLEKGGGMVFEVLKQALIQLVKDAVFGTSA